MQTVRNLNRFKSPKKSVVTIGNFDGIHAGHQKVILEVVRRARKTNGKSIVITFLPHTQAHLSLGSEYKVLTTPYEKAWLMRTLGVDYLLFLRFNKKLQNLSAADFLKEIVIKRIRPAVMVLGYDHRFGQGRRGDFEFVEKTCRRHNIQAVRVLPYKAEYKIISSTLIRELIEMGKIEAAVKLLGRPYAVHGRVTTGDRRGRQLGFPTANVDVPREKRMPPDGVYKGCCIMGSRAVPAVISLGTRPTFGGRERILEAYLLSYNGNLYGRSVVLLLDGFIRKQEKFSSQHALKNRIKKDVEYVNELN